MASPSLFTHSPPALRPRRLRALRVYFAYFVAKHPFRLADPFAPHRADTPGLGDQPVIAYIQPPKTARQQYPDTHQVGIGTRGVEPVTLGLAVLFSVSDCAPTQQGQATET